MKRQLLMLMLFAIALSTHLSSQTNNGQKVIEIDGVRGVFVPEDYYRHLREGNRKGISYYTNWKITEVQLLRSDSIAANNQKKADEYKLSMDKCDSTLNTCLETNKEADLKITELVAENNKLQKIKEFLPWGLGGSFVLGIVTGAIISRK